MTVQQPPRFTTDTQLASIGLRVFLTIGILVVITFGLLLVRLGPIAIPALTATVAVLAAALVDELTGRIPNRLVLIGFGWTAAGIPVVSSIESVSVTTVAIRTLIGLALGGAPILFMIWLLDPSLIGGGDWKLLALVGAALGLLLPIAAVVASLAACVLQFGRYFVVRERLAPFGPAIAAGLLVALATLPTASRLTGGKLG